MTTTSSDLIIMDARRAVETLRRSSPVEWPANAQNFEFAQQLDRDQDLVNLRDEFVIPTKAQLQRKSLRDLPETDSNADSAQSSIYFCGNSLGLQTKAVSEHLNAYLKTWGSIAVGGHFTRLEDSPLVPYQDMAAECARMSAGIVGAKPEEVVIMNTLTVNLHMMMAAFYKPTEKKHKIMCEWRPFPSDWVSRYPRS
jgi:kynureninase